MDISAANQLSAIASKADNGLGLMMLKKALDQSAASTLSLLDTLPQKDNAGTVVDVQA